MTDLRVLLVVLFAVVMMCAGYAKAASVIGDVPSAVADTCVYSLNSGAEVSSSVVVDTINGVPANGNRVCKVDVTDVPTGPNNIKVKLRSSVWGPATDSPFASLDFVRPASLTAPGTLRLVK